MQTDAEREAQYHELGWCAFPHDAVLAQWLDATLPAARAAIAAAENRQWLRYQETWFAGVNVLPNDTTGAVPGGPPLAGAAVDFIRDRLGVRDYAWDRAQVSVCYPGYPQPMPGESDAVFRFRRDRDAAHVDGLLKEGPERRRFLREHHAFILGIPMAEILGGRSALHGLGRLPPAGPGGAPRRPGRPRAGPLGRDRPDRPLPGGSPPGLRGVPPRRSPCPAGRMLSGPSPRRARDGALGALAQPPVPTGARSSISVRNPLIFRTGLPVHGNYFLPARLTLLAALQHKDDKS